LVTFELSSFNVMRGLSLRISPVLEFILEKISQPLS